ncbi:hypothetical protein Tco_1546229 [Tanacetum coccineum]
MHDGRSLQDLDQFYHVSYRHEDRTFTSQAWNMFFRIQEPVIQEYVLEFLSSKFRDHVMEIDIVNTKVFQLGEVKRSMTMRGFISALGSYIAKEINNSVFDFFRVACVRNRPNDYNPTAYFIDISTQNYFDTKHPPSYTTIKNPIRHLVQRFLTLSITGRHNAKEKITLEDLFFLHNMDGGEVVDVPWNVAKFLSDKAKGTQKRSMMVGAHLIWRIARYYGLMTNAYLKRVTLDQETTLLNVVKLVELGICRFNGLGLGELVADKLDDSKDEAAVAEARKA